MTESEMKRRDIMAAVPAPTGAPGRMRIAVIGIDRYRNWPGLSNAVRDARGALQLFEELGFERVGEPLIDDAATGAAIQALVTDELAVLEPEDSLVLFFAGHGGTRPDPHGDDKVKTGYLIPVDAVADGGKVATWIELDDWLRRVARLRPRHILVFLDACFAGTALTSIMKWRDSGTFHEKPLAALQKRRSRQIITSTLDDQSALDNGPILGHSLFTGCLIEGFRQGRLGHTHGVATGREVGQYLRERVGSYPHSRQMPDFGIFDRDDRGEIVIPLLAAPVDSAEVVRAPQTTSLAIATISGPTGDANGRAAARRRTGAILAAVALASVAAALAFELVRLSIAEESAAADAPMTAAEPRGLLATSASDAAVDIGAAAEGGVDATKSQILRGTQRPSAGSAASERAGEVSPRASAAKPRRTAPADATANVPSQPPKPSGDDVNDASAATARTTGPVDMAAKPPSPPSVAATTGAKPRAPRTQVPKSAVDEHDCPVKGSYAVTVMSIPKGWTLYINHKHCGELGKTPLRIKLPPSEWTTTRMFTAILERPGQPDVRQDFTVEKIRKLQVVTVRLP